MKKYTALLLALALAAILGVAACSGQTSTTENTNGSEATTTEKEINVGMANPWLDFTTLKDAEADAGFEMAVPATIDGYKLAVYRSMAGDMLEVRFTAGEEEINIRKSHDTYDGDNSGVYGDYKTKTADVNGKTVTIHTQDGTPYIATWTVDGYSYSVYASAGMKEAALLDIVAAVS